LWPCTRGGAGGQGLCRCWWGAEPLLAGPGGIHRRNQRPHDQGRGASHVIIGHSERRQYFGETEKTVSPAHGAALKARPCTPIFCIGETIEEREAGQTEDVLISQIAGGMAGLDPAPHPGSSWPMSRFGPSAPGSPPQKSRPMRPMPPSANTWPTASTRAG
jgi:hypothetical protein